METKEDSIIDKVIKGGWNSILNDTNRLYGSSSIGYSSIIESARELQKEIDRYKDSNKDKGNKRLLIIQNPEGLNTGDNLISGEWGITYGGRDLSLEEDNYCWIVTNRKSGLKGYYIVERELIQGDWLNIRWGKSPVSSKERKELIDKKRLRDKGMIQRDMITAILRGK